MIKKCIRSLLLHRLRTILSTLGVLFGVVAVIAMLSIGEGAKRETLEQIEQLGTNTIIVRKSELSEEQHIKARQNLSRGLTLEDAFLLQQTIPSVRYHAPLKIVEASITGTTAEVAPELMAVTRTFHEIKGFKLLEGRFICDADIKNRQPVCVLGYDVAKSLGKYGHVGQTLRIEDMQFSIVGILESKLWSKGKTATLTTRNLNKSIFIPLGIESSLPRRTLLKQDPLSEIIVQIQNREHIDQTGKLIKRILDKTHNGVEDYQIIIPQELLNQAQRTQQTFNLVLGSIAAISLLVGGIGIMNIMLANVSERTREIGIRRAVGANQVHIIIQFLSETLILTLFGAIIGVILGITCTYIISYFAQWKTIVTTWSIILSLGMASGVGLCAGLYPAIKAAAMDPIQALRHT